MSDDAMDEMTRQRAVIPGTRTDIARTGMGIAVREGAPKPDISTPEALTQTMRAARSLVYVDPAQGGTSGIHFAGVLERLGIAEAVKAKTRLVPGGYPAELVAKGEVELVAHQISEIVPVKGVALVGPLPKDLQKITTYSAGLAAGCAVPSRPRSAGTAAPASAPASAPEGAARPPCCGPRRSPSGPVSRASRSSPRRSGSRPPSWPRASACRRSRSPSIPACR